MKKIILLILISISINAHAVKVNVYDRIEGGLTVELVDDCGKSFRLVLLDKKLLQSDIVSKWLKNIKRDICVKDVKWNY